MALKPNRIGINLLALILALMLPISSFVAQEAIEADQQDSSETPQQDNPQSLTVGEPIPYVAEQIGKWSLICSENIVDPEIRQCSMMQDVSNEEGSKVATIEVWKIVDSELFKAGAIIVTPLGSNLEEAISLNVDAATPRRYRYKYCLEDGCLARIGLLNTELTALKRGKILYMTIFALEYLDDPRRYEISLEGFTDAFDAL